MRRRIPGKTRRDNQRRKRCIRIRRVVPVRLGHKNRRFRAPGGVLVFRVECRHRGVAHGHIQQREGARVFRQRISGGDAELSGDRVPHPYRRHGAIIARNVGPILRPDGAVCRAHGLDLVVIPCVSGALERGRFIQLELGGASQPERLHVSPLIECSPRGSAARRGLPFARSGRRRKIERGRRGSIVVPRRHNCRGGRLSHTDPRGFG